MFQPYQPIITPVKVYRASDVGAPQLKVETGSLKTLLKACLVNGYGEGINRKEPAGWQITGETANDAIFYTEYTHDIGLKIENSGSAFINAYMVGGEHFAQYLGYATKSYNNFAYNNLYPMANWILIACNKGFIFILPYVSSITQYSQILYFGKINGLYEDMGNIGYINTSAGLNGWGAATIGMQNREPLIVRSQWRDGGTLPLSSVICNLFSPFNNTSVTFPDDLYKNTIASALILTEKNGAVRGTLPALFWCYHNLQGIVKETDLIEMSDGQQYIKINLSNNGASSHCFVVNLEQWEL